MTRDIAARRLCWLGALLFGLGSLTGMLVSAAMTSKIPAEPKMMLASHLNALMGCFWLVALGATWQKLRLSEGLLRLLGRAAVVACYANWAVTLIKAFLRVHGIDFIGQTSNDAVFVALTALVVLPTLLASFLWIRGLWPQQAATAAKSD